VVGGTVYVGSFDNKLYAVDAATGSQRWAFDTGGSILSSPTVMGGTVYVGSYDSELYAVDAATGNQQWAFETGPVVYSSPTVVGGTVYVGSWDNNLYAVDAATGNQQWAFETGDDVESSPTVVNDPESGGSIGSRVMLGTLGYHGDWRYATAEFSVSVRETTAPVAGESLSVTVEVTASNGDQTTQTVSLSVPNLGSDSQQVTLSGGNTTTVTLSVPTSSGDAGEYTITVASPDDEATATATVDAQPTSGGTDGSGGGDNDGMGTPAMLAVGGGGGGLALLAAYYGLARRSDDDGETDTDDSDGPTDTPAAGPSPGEAPSGAETPATERVDDHLDTAKRRLNRARDPYESGDYDSALDHCKNALDAANEAREVARNGAPDRVTDTETAIQDVTQLRGQISAERDARQEAVSRLADSEESLDKARTALDAGNPDDALAHLDGVSSLLGTARATADEHGFSDLEDWVETLSQRRETLHQEIRTRQNTRQQAVDRLDRAEETLDEAETALDESSLREALDALDDAGAVLEQATTTISEHDLSGLTERASALEQRHAQFEEKAQKRHETRQHAVDRLDRTAEALDGVDSALDEGAPRKALDALDDAAAVLEQATTTISEHDLSGLTDRATALEQRHAQLEESAQTQHETRQRAASSLDHAEETLDEARATLDDGDAREALEILDSVPATLAETDDPLEAHDFTDLVERRDALETRYERLTQEAEDALTNIPAEIPTTPRRSITYDDIEKGDRIGSGGNADVYLATDGNGEFALKEPRMSGTLHTETVERMMDEAETWQQLDDHDHIVSVVDYDSQPLPWIAIEYMDAGHLGERVGQLAFEQKLWTAIATTKAVRHAHRRGVAHLDLKPENILFRRVEDAWDAPKVADWGLSKHLLDHSKSVEGMTVEYAAPEQFDDEYGAVDDITDVYQLGAVLYELFTGRPPFDGKPFKVMNRIQNEDPDPPTAVADVPAELDDILLRATATEKEDRYEDVLLLRNDLQTLSEEVAGGF
jgi:HEPN domain-containing protein